MATKQQLDREIAEALSRRDKPTTWMQARALHERGEYAGCDTFLLAYLPYHEMELYASSSAYGWGSYEECFDTLELAMRRLEQLREEGRIEWAKIYQHDRRYLLQRKLVDEWDDSREVHSTIKKRPTRQRAARLLRSSHATKAGQDRVPPSRRSRAGCWAVTAPRGLLWRWRTGTRWIMRREAPRVHDGCAWGRRSIV